MTGNLGYTEIASGQNQKEVTANDDFAIFDKAITEQMLVDLTSANVTITTTQFQQNIYFIAENNTVSRNITVPAVKRSFFFVKNTGTASVNIVRGSTSIALAANGYAIFSTDGTTNGLEAVLTSSAVINVAVSYSGAPTASQKVTIVFNDTVTLPSTLTGSNAVIGTNPDSTMTFDIAKNGTGIGSISFNTSGTPSITFTTATTFSPGDILTITAPGTPDATGADVGFNLRGTKG